jgi:tellurite methyltransferase
VQRDWDRYYSDPAQVDLVPDPLLVSAIEHLPPGDALDLASGPGRHALHLAALGWRVTAVDSSAVALDLLRQRAKGLAVHTVRADLERGEFAIQPAAFDLICDFLYLQRDLFPQMREGLRPGGLFAGAIRLDGTFRMHPGELRDQFAGWKILYYSETDAARIIVRKA